MVRMVHTETRGGRGAHRAFPGDRVEVLRTRGTAAAHRRRKACWLPDETLRPAAERAP